MGVYFEKTRKWWIVNFQFNKILHRKAGFKSKHDGIIWEGRERAKLGAPQTIPTPLIYFQEMATKYLEWCKLRMQPNSIGQKIFVYRSFLQFINGDQPAPNVTRQTVSKYLENRAMTKGNKSANRHLRDLKACYNWAIESEIDQTLIKNPCKGIKPLPENPYIPYVPPPEDIAKVFLVCNPDQREFLQCLYHLVARRAEIERLKWDDINFDQQTAQLYTRKRRGGALHAQNKPMNATIAGILKARYQRRDKTSPLVFQFGSETLSHMMPRLCRKAGIKPFGHHAIRHHVASFLRDAGKSTKHIQLLLGHLRESTTEIYVHVLPEGLRESVRVLEQVG